MVNVFQDNGQGAPFTSPRDPSVPLRLIQKNL
jgi:hypothetical protein